MLHPAHATPRIARIGVMLVLAAAGCTDPTPILGPPHDSVPAPDAAASKQSSTSGRILYTREASFSSGRDIYSMDDDGNSVIQLTSTIDVEVDASWAPDGKRVLYAAAPYGTSDFAIWVMNADGTGNTRLTNPNSDQQDLEPRAVGKRIVFRRADPATGYALWIMNEDGSDLTQLTSGPVDLYPAPSPGGKLVAFIRNNDVYVIDVETRAVTNLTSSPEREGTPAWSPGGKQIAFSRGISTSPYGDLYVMNADGTGTTQLIDTPFESEFGPRWSPDGKRIAFSATRDGRLSIWVMNADGTALNDLSRTHEPYLQEAVGAWAR
jgi:TolB protein